MIKYNGKEIKTTTFPNGETCIEPFKLGVFRDNFVEMQYENDKDFTLLMMIKNHLDENGIDNIMLQLPYIPYSRMDRAEDNGVFTLKGVCNFINFLNFKQVIVLEPHSYVAPALIKRCIVINSSQKIARQIIDVENIDKDKDVIYYPDATAYKRYSKCFKDFKYHMVGNKIRDFKTGDILSLEVVTASDNKPVLPFKVVMVDDLCSRGGTFILGAEKLKEMGATNIYLAITHCENSIFEGKIFKTDLIDKVYCMDTMCLKNTNKKLVLVRK